MIMFIVAAITTQRERARGTLERLMAMPLGKLDLLAGYALAFGLMACLQVTLVLVISLTWLGVSLPGSAVPMAVIAVLDAILGMATGCSPAPSPAPSSRPSSSCPPSCCRRPCWAAWWSRGRR